MAKLTKWFMPDEKPVREGWYHTSIDNADPRRDPYAESDYCWWWDGEFWRAYPNSLSPSFSQDRFWRGRTTPGWNKAGEK
jgi:hypothetical protein